MFTPVNPVWVKIMIKIYMYEYMHMMSLMEYLLHAYQSFDPLDQRQTAGVLLGQAARRHLPGPAGRYQKLYVMATPPSLFIVIVRRRCRDWWRALLHRLLKDGHRQRRLRRRRHFRRVSTQRFRSRPRRRPSCDYSVLLLLLQTP